MAINIPTLPTQQKTSQNNTIQNFSQKMKQLNSQEYNCLLYIKTSQVMTRIQFSEIWSK